MRIEYKQDGGFAAIPGLNKPFVLDSGDLAAAKAHELSSLIDACHFFDVPKVAPAPHPGAADYRRITLTVVDGKRRHTVVRSDPVVEPRLQALIVFVEQARSED